MNWLQKLAAFQAKRDWGLRGLEAEALKYDNFDAFEMAYIGQIKHGKYWHVTDNPNFFIDPTKGPRDQSSMAAGNSVDVGKLMVTSDLEHWASYYSKTRPYAALIDMREVPAETYSQVSRGFGNEFWVNDPSKAKVIGVFPIAQALRIDQRLHSLLPGSEKKLKEIYEQAHAKKEIVPEPVGR
jgi:hypothetical protein